MVVETVALVLFAPLAVGVLLVGVVALVLTFDDDRRREIIYQLGREWRRGLRAAGDPDDGDRLLRPGGTSDEVAERLYRRDIVRRVVASDYFEERVRELVGAAREERLRRERERPIEGRRQKTGGL